MSLIWPAAFGPNGRYWYVTPARVSHCHGRLRRPPGAHSLGALLTQADLATLGDVAALGGAPSRDVALVLAGVPMVEPELKQRETNALDLTGHNPLEAIQARLGRPLRLAIVFRSYRSDDPEANRFYTPLASAISIACVQQGASVRQATMNVSAQAAIATATKRLSGRERPCSAGCPCSARCAAGAGGGARHLPAQERSTPSHCPFMVCLRGQL